MAGKPDEWYTVQINFIEELMEMLLPPESSTARLLYAFLKERKKQITHEYATSRGTSLGVAIDE
jgi:hypothetical protein